MPFIPRISAERSAASTLSSITMESAERSAASTVVHHDQVGRAVRCERGAAHLEDVSRAVRRERRTYHHADGGPPRLLVGRREHVDVRSAASVVVVHHEDVGRAVRREGRLTITRMLPMFRQPLERVVG